MRPYRRRLLTRQQGQQFFRDELQVLQTGVVVLGKVQDRSDSQLALNISWAASYLWQKVLITISGSSFSKNH